MPAPEILAFGDGSHTPGETGLTIDGGGFGAFPGSAWIYQSADRSGTANRLTVTAWNDIQLIATIPSGVSTATGTRYLFVQREDLAWSIGFSFVFTASGGSGGGGSSPGTGTSFRLRPVVPLQNANDVEHRRQLADRVNASFAHDGTVPMSAPFLMKSYTVAALPTASEWTNAMVYVSDESGGAITAFSDGTSWRRTTDRAVVS